MYRVLVVDDEPLVCNFLRMKIEELNPEFQVSATASDGCGALEFLEKNQVELVITDIKMPRMDGLELCEKIRERYPDIYIVILSGYGEFEYAQRAIRYNVHSYLLKPIDNEELAKILCEITQEKKMMHQKNEEIKNSFRQIFYATSGSYERPDEELERQKNMSIVEKAKEYIWNNYKKPLGLTEIAENIGVSPNYLSNVFRREEGDTCMKYVTKVRMEVAGRYLTDNQILRLDEIAERTGFVNTKHFLHVFKKYYGMTPGEYKGKYKTDVKRKEENDEKIIRCCIADYHTNDSERRCGL